MTAPWNSRRGAACTQAQAPGKPCGPIVWRNAVLAATLAACALPCWAHRDHPEQHGPPQPLRIPLEQIGASPVAASLLAAGQSMLTVSVLDSAHLLVTFSLHQLLRRVPGAPRDDNSRIVQAEIVSLPDGNVLASTQWQTPDHARYLWPIGQGRFVLRIGDELSAFAPLTNPKAPFTRVALPLQPGSPVAIDASEGGDLITVITELPPPPQTGPKIVFGDTGQDNTPKPTYVVSYLRVTGAKEADAPMAFHPAGQLHADAALAIPVDADGYLWADANAQNQWTITFNDFAGPVRKAGTIMSSCPPRLRMVSRDEYIALTCRGDDDSPKLESLGLDGHETWEEPFSAFLETPFFVAAPAAGRFAMSRTSSTTIPGTMGQGDSQETDQEVRVYQTESGDLIAHVPLHPVFRVPENFDLGPDGRTLAVFEDDEIDVYTLPAPSKRDLQALAYVARFAPSANDAPVQLTRLLETAATIAPPPTALAPSAAPVAMPVSMQKTSSSPAPAVAVTPTTGRRLLTIPESTTTEAELPNPANTEQASTSGRKRPTLLLPGEVPEFRDKNADTQ